MFGSPGMSWCCSSFCSWHFLSPKLQVSHYPNGRTAQWLPWLVRCVLWCLNALSPFRTLSWPAESRFTSHLCPLWIWCCSWAGQNVIQMAWDSIRPSGFPLTTCFLNAALPTSEGVYVLEGSILVLATIWLQTKVLRLLKAGFCAPRRQEHVTDRREQWKKILGSSHLQHMWKKLVLGFG